MATRCTGHVMTEIPAPGGSALRHVLQDSKNALRYFEACAQNIQMLHSPCNGRILPKEPLQRIVK